MRVVLKGYQLWTIVRGFRCFWVQIPVSVIGGVKHCILAMAGNINSQSEKSLWW